MTLTINTPSLIFPAVSLIMLAYTNRYMALSSLVRNLHQQYIQDKNNQNIILQITNLRKRLRLVRQMQGFGVLSFISGVLCIFFIYLELDFFANFIFAITLLLFVVSLLLSFWEIQISTQALKIQLQDIDTIEIKTEK